MQATVSLLCLTVLEDTLVVRSYPARFFVGGSAAVTPTSNMLLYCQANSVSPTLEMVWMKDGVPLTTQTPALNYRRFSSDGISTLMLWAYPPSTGVYQCIARLNFAKAEGLAQHIIGIYTYLYSYKACQHA